MINDVPQPIMIDTMKQNDIKNLDIVEKTRDSLSREPRTSKLSSRDS